MEVNSIKRPQTVGELQDYLDAIPRNTLICAHTALRPAESLNEDGTISFPVEDLLFMLNETADNKLFLGVTLVRKAEHIYNFKKKETK